MNWYLEVLKKYAVFPGRARRKEYWYFILFNILIYAALVLIDTVGDLSISAMERGPLSSLYALAVFIPEIAVTARRLHDTGHSGWWQMIIIPLLSVQWLVHRVQDFWALGIVAIGLLAIMMLLLWMVRDSDPDENKWGPNPKKELVTAFD